MSVAHVLAVSSMIADTERVRAVADLASIAARYGVKLKRSGTQLVGLCPFHKERTPSFYVHPAKQVFKCHGCGAGGDQITLTACRNVCVGWYWCAPKRAPRPRPPLNTLPILAKSPPNSRDSRRGGKKLPESPP